MNTKELYNKFKAEYVALFKLNLKVLIYEKTEEYDSETIVELMNREIREI